MAQHEEHYNNNQSIMSATAEQSKAEAQLSPKNSNRKVCFAEEDHRKDSSLVSSKNGTKDSLAE
eukprot:3476655-Ditylum_brightwellii.AAC.1